MRYVRDYKLRKDILTCEVFGYTDLDEDSVPWLQEMSYYVVLSAKVGPRAVNLNDIQVRSKDAPRVFILDETIRFCQTLKTMYEL